ncbi:MFS transporter [Evansella halocellulosilytica]|uniref:MFS transporter n=1 Tax=Evansella halocellulosilytica TaxID=2011013 RepID=UPI000BB801A1|nr:MFS transporter [Evansella halocellulosilytica]
MHGFEIMNMEPQYRILFWSSFLNGVGSRFAQVGSFTLMYLLTESGVALGILMALRVLPTIIFSPISGYLADRFHKMKLLFATDLLRAPFALLPLVAVYTEQIGFLYMSTFIIASGEAVYQPVRYAAIPDIVQRKNLININGLEQNVVGGTLVIGSLTGGLIAFATTVNILFIFHSLFLLSAALIVWKLIHIKKEQTTEEEAADQSLKDTGLLIFNIALMRVFLLVMLLMPLANGVDNVLFNLIALDVFEKGDLGVGFIYAALGAGFILSSAATKWIHRKYIVIGILMIALEGVGHLLLSQSVIFAQALLLAVCITFVGGISNICFDTTLMKVLPSAIRGKVVGILAMIQNSSMGIAMIGAGFLTEWFSPMQSAFYVGVTYIGFAVLFMITFKQVKFRQSLRELKGTIQR